MDWNSKRKADIFLHSGFWILFYVLSIVLFLNFWSLRTSILRALLNGSLFVGVFYMNLLVLIPTFFSTRKYILYVFFSILLFVLFFVLRVLFRDLIFEGPTPFGISPRPYQSEFLIFAGFIFVFGLSIFYRLALNHMQAAERNREIIRQRDEAEFRMLKAQVNPHFLFNTLNNLYSLAYSRSEKTAGAIMSLSEIMRYLIYEAGAQQVSVEKEIRFITNYVELEKLRIEDPSKVSLIIEGPSPILMVYPLIFIAYVENAFKHSGIDMDPEGFIQIFLVFREGEILFTCENSIAGDKVKSAVGGVGLVNARSRLNLMYQERAKLEISRTAHVFTVKLTVVL
jgi:sensor histidine kinase YesM